MKTITLCVLLAFISATTHAQKNTVETNLKTYSELWDNIINDGQIDLINEVNFDPNITMILPPENIVGVNAFKAHYQNYLTGFSAVTFTSLNSFGQGDQIVKHWNFKGTHTGAFFGIPATGKDVNVEGVTIARMKNGKITQEHDFMDSSVFFEQLGLVSDPANMEVIDRLYNAFGKGDIPAALGVMDPKIVWNEAEGNKLADGNPYIGPEAVLNGVFARLPQDFKDFKLSTIELHEMSSNRVLATLRYTGKSLHNGKELDAQVAHLWTLTDGKIVAFQQYADTKQLDEMMKK